MDVHRPTCALACLAALPVFNQNYRVAFGAWQGQKALTLQTLAPRGPEQDGEGRPGEWLFPARRGNGVSHTGQGAARGADELGAALEARLQDRHREVRALRRAGEGDCQH